MFNLKKFKRQVVAAVTPPQDPQKVIAQIHNAFDTATDKILADAKAIIAQDFDTEKGERLKAVGFQNSKASVEAAKIVDEKKKSKELATLVE